MNQLLMDYPEEIREILTRYPEDYRRSAVMPLLYLVQRKPGYVTPEGIADVAEITGLSTTDVASVAAFYTLFHEEGGGRYRIQICTDLPCALVGAEQFLKEVSAELGIGPGETTPDGMFTIEESKCLAACHRAPMFQVQGDGAIVYHEHQTIDTARALFAELRQRAAAHTHPEQAAASAEAAADSARGDKTDAKVADSPALDSPASEGGAA